tara:strand:- start:2391 stop:2999 length:609 start_codon:yes stop_codon:yes gene_type:complete
MTYLEYIDKYLDKKTFFRTLPIKAWLFDSGNTVFFAGAFLFTLLGFFLAALAGSIGAAILGICLAIAVGLIYVALNNYLRPVLVGYEKEGVRYWEYIYMPLEMQKKIPPTSYFQIGEKNKFINVLIKINNDYRLWNPFDIKKTFVHPQKLTAVLEQSALSRYSKRGKKSAVAEAIQKGTILIILGGEGFLIYVMMNSILAKT